MEAARDVGAGDDVEQRLVAARVAHPLAQIGVEVHGIAVSAAVDEHGSDASMRTARMHRSSAPKMWTCRCCPPGQTALLVECEDGPAAAALAAEAFRRREAGVLSCTDIVPAARTVLLDGLDDVVQRSARRSGRWTYEQATGDADQLVEIAVRYDGPDLEQVARCWDVTSQEVVARHCGQEHRVQFCGFAPGFAYLAGLPPEYAVPRLARPRTSVPAGSVGLADRYTGIYPTSSPGGWQLIGTALDVVLVRSRSPAACAADAWHPGAFRGGVVSRPSARRPASGRSHDRAGSRPPGLETPRGSPFRRAGRPAAALANRLVGNAPEAAVLETTMDGVGFGLPDGGLDLRHRRGGPGHVDGRPAAWSSGGLGGARRRGRGRTAVRGVRSYVAVDGGVDAPAVLGSRATDLLSGLGPPPLARRGRAWARQDRLAAAGRRGTGARVARAVDDLADPARPQVRLAHRRRNGQLTSAAYEVSPDSNRVAIRLAGPPLVRRPGELPSEGTVIGGVQVPADGQPLIFLADHPTTVGYPVVAIVAPGRAVAVRPVAAGSQRSIQLVTLALRQPT